MATVANTVVTLRCNTEFEVLEVRYINTAETNNHMLRWIEVFNIGFFDPLRYTYYSLERR